MGQMVRTASRYHVRVVVLMEDGSRKEMEMECKTLSEAQEIAYPIWREGLPVVDVAISGPKGYYEIVGAV